MNRERAIQKLRGGAIALSGYGLMQRTNDITGAFTQEANFWYLTGINDPDWQVIIDGRRNKSWLVCPHVSREQEVFGGCLRPEEAMAISGIDEIVDATEALNILRQLARTHSLLYTCDQPAQNFTLNPAPREFRQLLERYFAKVQDCRADIATLRSIKLPQEIDAIKQAIKVTEGGLEQVRTSLAKYSYEYEVEADITHAFRSRGCHHAYAPIIAGGGNACTLHYEHNNDRLKKRSLLLMDVGASYEHYAADITRTYAIGEPTKRQAAVHAAVCDAQERIIELCQPGTPLTAYREQADQIMEKALVELKLMDPGNTEQFYTYFPHAVGHGLGIDVHDSLGQNQYLLPGMVVTVEPGIYIPAEGIGVRIEDDILIGEKGPVNLSAKLSTSMN